MSHLQEELADLLNRHSRENASDTPDFILAAYLAGCLEVFEQTVRHRERWYGRPAPGTLEEKEVFEPYRDNAGRPVTLMGLPVVVNPDMKPGEPPVFGPPLVEG